MTTDIEHSLARYELVDTQAFMDDIAAEHELVEGRVLLALVIDPTTRQRVTAVVEVSHAPSDDPWDRSALSDELAEAARALPIPSRDRAVSVIVTVVVRPGINGWGPVERLYAMGWRYSNHFTDAFDADIISVTEHGWASLWSHAAGTAPRMER